SLRPPLVIGVGAGRQRAAEQVFDLPERQHEAVGVSLLQVFKEHAIRTRQDPPLRPRRRFPFEHGYWSFRFRVSVQRRRAASTGTRRNSESASAVVNTCPVAWFLSRTMSSPSRANIRLTRSSRDGSPPASV